MHCVGARFAYCVELRPWAKLGLQCTYIPWVKLGLEYTIYIYIYIYIYMYICMLRLLVSSSGGPTLTGCPPRLLVSTSGGPVLGDLDARTRT